jgi:hypothetical protein
MRRLRWAMVGVVALGFARAEEPDRAAVERGRRALTETGYLPPAWSDHAYQRVRQFLGPDAPDPDREPDAYATAFCQHYGLHPAPYPNDGLPMGLRRGNGPDGSKKGLQIDCLVCHGGSIGGKSYIGLGNTTLDLDALLADLNRADGKMRPLTGFVLNSSRGTVNAPQVAAVLISLRNTDLSWRRFPLPLGAHFPEMDVPAWWLLKRKQTLYSDGRTDARAVRSHMQFLLGDLSLEELKALEPTFRDIVVYLKSIEPPKYPFPIDRDKAARGAIIFRRNCAKCHGTYGPEGEYPNRIVELKVIGTDPARALGMSDRLVAHYNSTWFAEEYPVDETMTGYQAPPLDGLWATAPYLHNGSVPSLATLLNSKTRPKRFRRPPSTDFAHYDQVNVGWKFEPVPEAEDAAGPASERRWIFDSTRFGLGNGGHTFGDPLSDADRMDLIEYLKTL